LLASEILFESENRFEVKKLFDLDPDGNPRYAIYDKVNKNYPEVFSGPNSKANAVNAADTANKEHTANKEQKKQDKKQQKQEKKDKKKQKQKEKLKAKAKEFNTKWAKKGVRWTTLFTIATEGYDISKTVEHWAYLYYLNGCTDKVTDIKSPYANRPVAHDIVYLKDRIAKKISEVATTIASLCFGSLTGAVAGAATTKIVPAVTALAVGSAGTAVIALVVAALLGSIAIKTLQTLVTETELGDWIKSWIKENLWKDVYAAVGDCKISDIYPQTKLFNIFDNINENTKTSAETKLVTLAKKILASVPRNERLKIQNKIKELTSQ